MDTQNTVVEIGYYRWPRDLAIHEAGHAIAAWFFGNSQVEISLGKVRISRSFLPKLTR